MKFKYHRNVVISESERDSGGISCDIGTKSSIREAFKESGLSTRKPKALGSGTQFSANLLSRLKTSRTS